MCQTVSNQTVGDPLPPDPSTMSSSDSTFQALQGWQTPAHTSTCPVATFSLASMHLGTYTIDYHCTLFDSVAAILQAVMVAVYSVLALFIVLRA